VPKHGNAVGRTMYLSFLAEIKALIFTPIRCTFLARRAAVQPFSALGFGSGGVLKGQSDKN